MQTGRTTTKLTHRDIEGIKQAGFEVIYAYSHSVFVKGKYAIREDYERLAKIISEEVKLPIALDHHFKFLVLLYKEGKGTVY